MSRTESGQADEVDWLLKTRAMLLRFRDETRAGYVGLRMKHGAAAAAHILEDVGIAMVAALGRLELYEKTRQIPRDNAPPPAADEDAFG